jgi:hypothetical protein
LPLLCTQREQTVSNSRIARYSLPAKHLHLIVEADGNPTL